MCFQDDENLEGYNVPERVNAFVAAARAQAAHNRGNDIMFKMGM